LKFDQFKYVYIYTKFLLFYKQDIYFDFTIIIESIQLNFLNINVNFA